MCARRYPGAAALGFLALCPSPGSAAQPDPTQLSVEELMQVSVYSASKFDQKTAEAPASVTVITADEIRAYGYRTLADVLRSVRGFFVAYDRNYAYLGVRGFERPGDYDSRVLLLVDGHRANDTIYDTAGIGTEFAVDIDDIQRLEIVRGPGSAIYGSNAFFAVINVITRSGADTGALQGSVEGGSWHSDKERLATGHHADGIDGVLSASRYRSAGQDLEFPGQGVAQGLDGDEYRKVLGKVSARGATVSAGYSDRTKQVPTAAFGSAFGDPRLLTTDEWEFFDVDYRHALDPAWELEPRVSYGRYFYRGTYPIAPQPATINYDFARAQWWSTEVKAIGRLDRHKLVAGLEYQDNFQQDLFNYDQGSSSPNLDDKRHSERHGVYLEDEFAATRSLGITSGLRLDHYSTAGEAVNPRLAVVWSPLDTTTFKALAGTAFRAPNDFELYGTDGSTTQANPDLSPERITTFELVAEHYLDPNFRATGDVYYNRIRNLIEQVPDPGGAIFRNIGRAEGRGAELELERVWPGGARARTSYAWQESRDLAMDTALTNSPRHLAKLNVFIPVAGAQLGVAPEVQYMSRRTTLAGAAVGGAVVTNLTLTSRPCGDRFQISASVFNLLDHDYADPARPEHEPAIDAIPQDGRSFWLKLSYGL